MTDQKVIDITGLLKKKADKENMKSVIQASGWDIDEKAVSYDSQVCIYLVDTTEPGILLFGLSKNELPSPSNTDHVHWGHFVLAWDVIADPEMPFDDLHKQTTMNISVKALSTLDEWPAIHEKLVNAKGDNKAHLIILIDRKDMESPKELIVAYSTAPVLNSDSLAAIVDNHENQ